MARSRSPSRDRELVEAAREVLAKRHRPGRHSVGAALRGSSGRVYAAVNVNGKYVGRVDVCAEAIAVGMAVAGGETRFESIVAVQRPRDRRHDGLPRVVPPCGICREMLNDYDPNVAVLLPGPRGAIRRRRAKDLLPDRYVDP